MSGLGQTQLHVRNRKHCFELFINNVIKLTSFYATAFEEVTKLKVFHFENIIGTKTANSFILRQLHAYLLSVALQILPGIKSEQEAAGLVEFVPEPNGGQLFTRLLQLELLAEGRQTQSPSTHRYVSSGCSGTSSQK